jgi:hypothetical protein
LVGDTRQAVRIYKDFANSFNFAVSLAAPESAWFVLLGVGLLPLAYWDCGFESHRGHGYLSVVTVVCCQVEVCATG